MIQGERTADEVRERIRAILEGPEFHRDEGALQRWIEDKIGRDFFGFGAEAASTFGAMLLWGSLAIVAILLAWALVRMVPPRVPRERAAAPPRSRASRVAALRERARAAEREGDHLLAMRLYFTALVLALGEHGDLEYRDAWTNRELLERGKPGPRAQSLLAPLVPVLDRHSFGGLPARTEDVSRLAGLLDGVAGTSP